MSVFRRSLIFRTFAAAAMVGLVVVGLAGCSKDSDDDDGSDILNGFWDRGDIVVRIDGGKGVFHVINSGDWKTLQNNKKINIGDLKFKNIKHTGGLTWTCQNLWWEKEGTDNNTYWDKATITMSSDYNKIEVEGVSYTRDYRTGQAPPELVEDEDSGQ